MAECVKLSIRFGDFLGRGRIAEQFSADIACPVFGITSLFTRGRDGICMFEAVSSRDGLGIGITANAAGESLREIGRAHV